LKGRTWLSPGKWDKSLSTQGGWGESMLGWRQGGCYGLGLKCPKKVHVFGPQPVTLLESGGTFRRWSIVGES
jgi:hypothetical protein